MVGTWPRMATGYLEGWAEKSRGCRALTLRSSLTVQCPSIKLETCLLRFWVSIREVRNLGDVEILQTAGCEVAGAEAFCKLEVSHLKPLSSLGISATWLSAGRAVWH